MIRWFLILFLWPMAAVAQDIWQIERDLAAIGYDPGPVDGISDAKTKWAIQSFQFGYRADATGQLTALEQQHLAQMVQLAQIQTPFILPNTDEVDPLELGPRTLYANGLHYLTQWKIRGISSQLRLESEIRTAHSDQNAARFRQLREQALELATNSQNQLGLAVLHLAEYERSENEFSDTLSAFKTLLSYAENQPSETAYIKAIVRTVEYHISQYKLCAESGGDVFYPLIQRAAGLYANVGATPGNMIRLQSKLLACAPPDQKDVIFQYQLELAKQVSNKVVIGTLTSWARDAAERGRNHIARTQLKILADYYLTNPPVRTLENATVDEGLIDPETINLMHSVGLAQQARQLGAQRIERIEGTDPKDIIENVSAAMGGFDHAIHSSAMLFIETRQFDHFYRLGVYERDRNGTLGPSAEDRKASDKSPWHLAVPTVKKGYFREDLSRRYARAEIILPELLRVRAMVPAMEVSLYQAKIAEEMGRYEDAEAAIVLAVSIAETLGQQESIKATILPIQRAMNLSRLKLLPPAERLLEQMNVYYQDACVSIEAAKTAAHEFFEIDYDALNYDPRVAESLLKSDAMNKLLGCHFPHRLQMFEVRFICAVAGISGRRDVADFLLQGRWEGLETWNKTAFTRQCAYGVADAGKLDWVHSLQLTGSEQNESSVLWYLSLDPAARAQVSERASLTDLTRIWGWENVGMDILEKDLPTFQRQKLAEDFNIKFYGGYGRIGPSPREEAMIRDSAIAFQRMGFYRAAEIYFANDQRVDPFAFGQENEAKLNDELVLSEHIRLRIRYANLYRDQGELARAYAAIGPLAEHAIKRLGSASDPLPGTIEQWAKRFEPLFSAYLELQFDGLPQGPNYPAIFAIQQYLQLANSTASASVLEQRLNSASPDVARDYQDARRELRDAINTTSGGGSRIAKLSLKLQTIEARLPTADAALRGHQIGVTQTLQDVMAELRKSGAAMVVTTQLSNSTVMMYLDGQGARARKIDLSRSATEAKVAAFRRGVLDSTENLDQFDPNLASSLYNLLIGWGHVGKPPPTALRLVMDGPFTTLPFAALRRSDGWLGAQAALRLAPSVARATTELRVGKTFRGFVGLGDPNLTKGDVTGRSALLGADFYLPELPETANELTFMAISFGGNPNKDVFTQQDASESLMRALDNNNRLADISILALATHGLLSRETGALNSAGLVLSLPTTSDTDGILTATEIYDYRIGADLVVLSACNTGTPGAGEGLSDLASAFLYSGAGALLLTHWEIDSGAGVEIMKRIAIDQRSDAATDYVASLKNAVAGMLEDDGLKKYHHPRFWASHFILG